jgi:hypothetical protein
MLKRSFPQCLEWATWWKFKQWNLSDFYLCLQILPIKRTDSYSMEIWELICLNYPLLITEFAASSLKNFTSSIWQIYVRQHHHRDKYCSQSCWLVKMMNMFVKKKIENGPHLLMRLANLYMYSVILTKFFSAESVLQKTYQKNHHEETTFDITMAW